MKTYSQTEDGSYIFKNTTISNSEGNPRYRKMQEEVTANIATIVPYDTKAKARRDKDGTEKSWALAKLDWADKELSQVQDGEGVGLVQDWRKYRVALRKHYHNPTGLRPPFNIRD